MANDLTSTPHLLVCDTIGIIAEKPIYVSNIYYVPSAVDDDVLFKQWDENAPVAAGTQSGVTGTITLGTTMTSTGNLPSTVADGHIFHILGSAGGAAANVKRALVTTAGNNNAVVCSQAGYTNEASIVYRWTTYPTTTAIVLRCRNLDITMEQMTFNPPRKFPNLSLETIDGGTVYIYLAQSGV
jgi:hypothetical protein